jgi:hypothetical protein
MIAGRRWGGARLVEYMFTMLNGMEREMMQEKLSEYSETGADPTK